MLFYIFVHSKANSATSLRPASVAEVTQKGKQLISACIPYLSEWSAHTYGRENIYKHCTNALSKSLIDKISNIVNIRIFLSNFRLVGHNTSVEEYVTD